jgi:hypothetical protein
MKKQTPSPSVSMPAHTASLSVLVLMHHWRLSAGEQQQLLALAQCGLVQELILVGREVQELPAGLAGQEKLRCFQLDSSSQALLTEAGAFEAGAEVLVILQQGIGLPEPALHAVGAAVAGGCHFGGFIPRSRRWWAGLLKSATVHCKGLFWFHLTRGYFVSRKVYHHSGGFKNDGRLISFFELLCRQEKLSRYTFLFY